MLAKALGGAKAKERAAVFLALVAGVQMMRQTMGLPGLVDASAADLRAVLLPIVRSLVAPKRKR